MLSITRRYTFAAAHQLAHPDWDPGRNAAVYGRCANPHGHGHNYLLFVTVTGERDARTGMLVDLAAMDRVVGERVLSRLDHRFLNLEIGRFRTTVPTSEALCHFVWDELCVALAPARLVRILLYETENNCFEYRGD
ncbi:MAG: 6-carboxytetrahydropterin synthase [Acidobacteria bacterium]|nr:6-carboxytetrahydropterin synthase [Acidobacteriota bacterium]